MKIIERYSIVDADGVETPLNMQMEYIDSNLGDYSPTKMELLKHRDDELRLHLERHQNELQPVY
jgi:hypothetical protein